MAIFSRRTIQRLIDENAAFLSRKQLRNHVDQLNKVVALPASCVSGVARKAPGARTSQGPSLAFEWEVAILNALNKLGTVEHEPNLGGTSRPDLFFKLRSDPSQAFVADIVTVSDDGIDKQNPVNALMSYVLQEARKYDLRENSFSLRVGLNDEEELDGEGEVQLRIPGEGWFREKYQAKLSEFLELVAKTSSAPREMRDEETDLLLTYRPNQGFVFLTYPDYKQIRSSTRTAVYNSLRRKAEQLSSSGDADSPRGVILCDGGNSLLSSRVRSGSTNLNAAILSFLRDYPAVHFVLTVGVRERSGPKRRASVLAEMFKGQWFEQLGHGVVDAINRLVGAMPEPERDAANALHLLRGSLPNSGASFFGGFKISSSEIVISSRTLQEYLAGRISQERFHEAYHFIPGRYAGAGEWNPFNRKLQEGKTISAVDVKNPEYERDDDWLVIKFEAADRALIEREPCTGCADLVGNPIAVSSSVLLLYFAGKLTQEDFYNEYHFMPGGCGSFNIENPFERKLQEGKLIKAVTVERKVAGRDDPSLRFWFSGPDPAIKPFRVPEQKNLP